MKLSEELSKWRVDRPDEWKMDEFIRNAAKLEAERDALAAAFKKVKSECVTVSNICHNLAYGSRNTESILQSIDSLKNAISNFENVTGDDLQQQFAELKAQTIKDAIRFCNHHMAFPVNRGEIADKVIAVDELIMYADSIRRGEVK